MAFFSRYYKTAVLVLVALAVIGGALTLMEYLRSRRSNQHSKEPVSRPA
jgi:hypothetical protein